jgi:hypothetical protein
MQSAGASPQESTPSPIRGGVFAASALGFLLSLLAGNLSYFYLSPEPVRLGPVVILGPSCRAVSRQRERARWMASTPGLHRATRARWELGPWTVYQYRGRS